MPTLQDTFQCDAPVALVTGSGAPRVGREIAIKLSALGCRLALHANESIDAAERVAEQLRQRHGADVIVTQGALDDESVPARLVEETHQYFGRFDILVNSAAVWRPTKLEAITPQEIRDYFNINTLASFLGARAAGLKMVDQPCGGSIVNIGDWATVRPYLEHAAYFPSKGAVEVMTRSLAVELAQLHPSIRVNCIKPGPVLLAEDVSEEHQARIVDNTLVRRVGSPTHIAHAVQFLCENDFVTGVCLPVDGGRSIFACDGMQVGMNTG